MALTQPWRAERPVSAELARALVESQFPALAPAHAEPFGAGWDNTVFLVKGAWVFRFPRRKVAVPLLETELRLLPRIGPLLPLPVPAPTLQGTPTPDFPWPFAGYALIPGRTADRTALTADQRVRAAEDLGAFLKVLHALPAEALPEDGIGRLDAARLRSEIRRRLGEAPAWIDDPVRVPRGDALVHGDLHARQLLFQDGTLCGVIDWGDAHRGDPAVDLAVAHSFLPAEARPAFLRTYGPVDPETWRLARLRALHVAAALAEWAMDTADGPLLEEANAALARC